MSSTTSGASNGFCGSLYHESDHRTDDKSLCFSVYCDSRYAPYIPWYIMSALAAYPNAAVRAFCFHKLGGRLKNTLSALTQHGDWQVFDECSSKVWQNTHGLKTVRWLLYPEQIHEFDNVYNGDIDILICPEQPTLLERHLERCNQFSLPYSNWVRKYPRLPARLTAWHRNRMYGVHFTKREWFEETAELRERWLKWLGDGVLFKKLKCIKNEHVLYLLAEKSVGLPPEDEPDLGQLHGIHLGIWRNWRKHRRAYEQVVTRCEITDHPFTEYARFYESLKGMPAYQRVVAGSKPIMPIVRRMERFVSRWLKDNP